MRSNPSSKRGQVRTAFNNGGEAEALKVGKALNLPEAKVRRWIRKFGQAKVPSRATDKQEVQLLYWPEKKGIVVQPGPEVSGVKFSDGTHRFVSNTDLENL